MPGDVDSNLVPNLPRSAGPATMEPRAKGAGAERLPAAAHDMMSAKEKRLPIVCWLALCSSI